MARVSRGRVRKDDLEGRRKRAEGILAAAGELIERWGYDKTTVDDIAATAGVAKGTLYLHWKTREALFVAVLRRERVGMLAEVQHALATRSEPASPRVLFAELAAAVGRRPMLRAVLLRDMDVLGRLADERTNRPTDSAWRQEFFDYADELRELGALREDWNQRQLVNLITVAFMGTFVSSGLLPKYYQLSDADQADLVAEMIHRAIDPGGRLGAKAVQAVARATTEYVDRALAVARQQLDESIGLVDVRKEDA